MKLENPRACDEIALREGDTPILAQKRNFDQASAGALLSLGSTPFAKQTFRNTHGLPRKRQPSVRDERSVKDICPELYRDM
jgi:hypothetical protein